MHSFTHLKNLCTDTKLPYLYSLTQMAKMMDPVHNRLEYFSFSVIQAVVEHESDFTCTLFDGHTCFDVLTSACITNYDDAPAFGLIFELLVQHGLSQSAGRITQIQNDKGDTTLHRLACRRLHHQNGNVTRSMCLLLGSTNAVSPKYR